MLRRLLIRGLCSHSTTTTRFLRVGDVLSETRQFSSSDVVRYADISGDRNPLHLDADFARKSGFEDGQIVHGMLVASLFPSIIASHFPGAVYVSQSLHFKLPVYVGDEIVAEVQATNIRGNRKRHIVKFTTKSFRSTQDLVLDGEATAILPNLTLNNR